MTAEGKLTTLYTFCAQLTNCADGASPNAGLIQGTDGNFYGTTQGGGTYGTDGYGTVFELSRETGGGCPTGSNTGTGWCETVVCSFCAQADCTDGAYPTAGLLQATNGTFYGTTAYGGANCQSSLGCGTVFSLGVGFGPFVETNPTSGAVGTKVTARSPRLSSRWS
jgi:hypothetical protein